jgi:hypothetical protein
LGEVPTGTTISCISQIMRPHLKAAAELGLLIKASSPSKPGSDITQPDTEGTIFARLTDSRLYTGHHKHRFDPSTGEGRGLSGRDSLSKGSGSTVPRPGDNGRVADISQLMRTNLHPRRLGMAEENGGTTTVRGGRRFSSPMARDGQEVTIPQTQGTIFERLTDPTEYTGQ